MVPGSPQKEISVMLYLNQLSLTCFGLAPCSCCWGGGQGRTLGGMTQTWSCENKSTERSAFRVAPKTDVKRHLCIEFMSSSLLKLHGQQTQCLARRTHDNYIVKYVDFEMVSLTSFEILRINSSYFKCFCTNLCFNV